MACCYARGDYMFLIGDDDHVAPNGIETLVSALGRDVVLALGRRQILDADVRMQTRCVFPEDPDPEFFRGWPFNQYEVPRAVWRIRSYRHGARRWEWKPH